MKLRNVLLVLKDQGPPRRFLRNLFKGHLFGLWHVNSHVSQSTGKLKVMYNTKASAVKSAAAMTKKHGGWFSNYKCLHCDGFHIGKNRDNKNNWDPLDPTVAQSPTLFDRFRKRAAHITGAVKAFNERFYR